MERITLCLFLQIIFVVASIVSPSPIKSAEPDIKIKVEGQGVSFTAHLPNTATARLKIGNEGLKPDRLINAQADIPSVSTKICKIKNFQTGEVEDIKRMSIPAKSTIDPVVIRLFNIPDRIKIDEEFILLLKFEQSGQKNLKLKFSSFEAIQTDDLKLKAKMVEEMAKRSRQ